MNEKCSKIFLPHSLLWGTIGKHIPPKQGIKQIERKTGARRLRIQCRRGRGSPRQVCQIRGSQLRISQESHHPNQNRRTAHTEIEASLLMLVYVKKIRPPPKKV